MKCSEVMKHEVECCAQDESAVRAAERMRDRNVGFVPICDATGRVIGTITDRDLCLRVIAAGLPADSTTVEQVMTRDVIACKPTDDLQTCEQLMESRQVSRVLCLDEQGRPAGVISLSDVAEVEQGGRAAKVLRAVSGREVSVH